MAGQTEADKSGIRNATILVNPAARGIRRFDGDGALRFLRHRDIAARIAITESAAHASTVAEDAAVRGDDLLFVVGGDGTLRDAARGAKGSPLPLAAIPAGTANVLAKEVGIPRGVRTAFEAHLGGQTVAMDAGRANGDIFLMMAGIGWDADVVGNVNSAMKRRTGQLAYAVTTVRRSLRLRTVEARWSSGLAHWQGPLAQMVVSNTRLYGGLFEPTPAARMNDGELDFVALCPRRRGDGLRLALRLVLRRAGPDARVLAGRVPELFLETPGIPYQLDGDFGGTTPVHLDIEPLALRLRIPAGQLPAAFAVDAPGNSTR
jgi:YegS/Rv2252/BmrU family lipid kinase